MVTITDFDAWLEEADLEGHEEIYALYKCVLERNDYGIWECKSGTAKNKDKLFIKAGHTENTLMIASEEARDAFLKLIVEKYVPASENGDIEMWYGFKRAMAKDD